MTISIESHIEELRAELELAEAELIRAIAEQSGEVDAEPPF